MRLLLMSGVAATVLTTLSLNADSEDSYQRTFSVDAGGVLTVEVAFGSIEVTGTDGNEVVIDVQRRVRGKSAEAERSFLSDRAVGATQEGNRVTVRTAKPLKPGSGWNSGMKETSGKFVIRVPAKYDVHLDTSGGAIAVTDVAGDVRAGTSGGGLKFVRITGPIQGNTAGGHVVLTGCQGELKVKTSGGGIDVTGGGGSLKANTSGGNILVKDFAGPAKVETSGGGLTIENVGGEVKGGTSGGAIRATLPQPVPGPVRLETSGGGITVGVASDAVFELDAATSGGNCSTAVALARQTSNPKERGVLRGAYGEGGPKVVLRSAGGSIRVQKSTELR